ncbi:MAG: GAF domain-containing sensor histidine kinase, partial [Bacteroidales bacterium]
YDQNVQQMLYEIARQSMTYIKIEELLQLVKLELGRVMDSSNLYVALISQTTGRLEPVQISGNEMVWPENQEQLEMARLILEKGRSMVLNEKEMDDFAMQNGLETKNSAKACLCVPIKDSDKSRGILILKSYKSPDAYDLQKSRLAEMVARELSLILQKEATMNEMKTAKERAEESDRLKSAFLSNISHEIRTPMNGILGFMELLSEPGLDEGQREEYLALMEKSGKRLLDTINAIVEVSKIEAGQLQVNLNIVDCNEIMDFHYNFFERQIVGKGLEFIKGKSIPKENSIIYSDQFKLEAILTNLINNAMKFTNEGFIEFGNYMEEDQLCFYVKDTGIGIPKDKMDSVFNRFVQADSHFSRPYEGSGLGLSIVKGYVESINGKIFLESEEGKGTLFTFKIPYIPGKIAEDTD